MVCGQNGVNGTIVANLVAMGLILGLDNVYHPSLEVLIVMGSTVILKHVTPITVLVSAETP